jgi:hypothetical protein
MIMRAILRRLGVALVVASLAASTLQAQTPAHSRFPRKWIAAGIGTALGALVSGIYAAGSERDIGGCSSKVCVVSAVTLTSGLVGLMIGGELDQLYRARYAHAPPMKVSGSTSVPLSVLGNDITLSRRHVFVAGEGGVELVDTDAAMNRVGLRARGLRGITNLTSDSASNTLLIGTGVGLYKFQIDGDEPGTLARSGEISAVSGDGMRVALGLGPGFQIGQVEDTVRMLGETIPEDTRVVDLAWAGNDILWVLSEERLVSYRVAGDGTVEALGADTLAATARRLTVIDSIALVAAGTGGVFAIVISDPADPRNLWNWSGARFAYDAALTNNTAYVAAGPEGLYVLALTADGFVARGLIRQVGFVAAIEADSESVYLLDRTGGLLRRIPATGH